MAIALVALEEDKTFTDAIIMQLSEEGLVSLDDPIEAWIPGWYEGPTLRHLLSHTSGIASYKYVGSFDKSRSWTPDELIQWAYDNDPDLKFTPGAQFDYSNTNFVLLGTCARSCTSAPEGRRASRTTTIERDSFAGVVPAPPACSSRISWRIQGHPRRRGQRSEGIVRPRLFKPALKTAMPVKKPAKPATAQARARGRDAAA